MWQWIIARVGRECLIYMTNDDKEVHVLKNKNRRISFVAVVATLWISQASAFGIPGTPINIPFDPSSIPGFNQLIGAVVSLANTVASGAKAANNAAQAVAAGIANTANCIANSVVTGGQCAASAVRSCPNQTPWGIAYKLTVQKQSINDISDSAIKGYADCAESLCCLNNELGFEPGYGKIDAACSAFNAAARNGDDRAALVAMVTHISATGSDPLNLDNIRNIAQGVAEQALHHCTPGL